MSKPLPNIFEITRRSPRPVNMLLSPLATAYPRGTALQESATAGTAELADGSKPFAGFLTRDTVVGGPVLGDIIYPGRLELPTATGDECSLEFGEEVEAEGANFIDSSITGATALKTPCSFAAGKFATASSGNFVEFVLVAIETPAVTGNVRGRFRVIPGYVHA